MDLKDEHMKTIGRSLAHNRHTTLARGAYKVASDDVMSVVVKKVVKESKTLCHPNTMSTLRLSNTDNIATFTTKDVISELRVYAPTLLTIRDRVRPSELLARV